MTDTSNLLTLMQFVWTQERKQRAIEMWERGDSARMIAAEFGVTRNAVIGKMRRIGARGTHPPKNKGVRKTPWSEENTLLLKLRRSEGVAGTNIAEELGVTKWAVWQKAREIKAELNWSKVRHPGLFGHRAPTRQPHNVYPDVTPIADYEIPAEQRKTLMQLGRHDCHWPIGDPQTSDFFFCGGERVPASSYCAAHHQRACDQSTKPRGWFVFQKSTGC